MIKYIDYANTSQNKSDEILPDVHGNPREKANLSNEFGTNGLRKVNFYRLLQNSSKPQIR